MEEILLYLLATAAAVTIPILVFKALFSTKHNYPPGPQGLPVLGNIRDIPPSREWIKYAEWSREYKSAVVHLNLAGTHLMIVNTFDAAYELFEKRSAIYSDRPRLPMLVELVGWDWSFGLYRYGQKWRDTRKIFHGFFGPKVVAGFEPQHNKVAHELLYRLANKPEAFMDHIRLMTGSLILSITYGIDVKAMDDPFLLMVEKAMETLSLAGNPGAFLVDVFPLLKYVPSWMPGAGFKRKAQEWRKSVQATADVPLQYVKDEMAKGTHIPSITSKALDEYDWRNDEYIAEAIRSMSAGTFAAGADTTNSTLSSFFLAMVLYPEVLRKAQDELDRVVGRRRLPDFSDKAFLPYICALVQEVLRWAPVTPLAVGHRLTADDTYEGHYLPSGSLVLGNAWAILNDEEMYPSPEVFNPDRFLKDGQLNPKIRSPETVAFGFGRRICAGKDFAIQSVFINIACILSTFDIGMATDPQGQPIRPNGEYKTGLLCYPLPFECSIKLRSAMALELVNTAYSAYH